MIYLKWLILALSNLPLKYLLAWPLTPVAVLFAKDGWLPWWLSYFQTPDNSLDGDDGWKTESRPYLNESNWYKRYINRCYWLWRNSLYGFNDSVLSYKIPPVYYYDAKGNELVSNFPNGVEGYVFRTVRTFLNYHNIECWHFYYIKQLPFWKGKCLRINIGWKLFQPLATDAKAHLALSIWFNKYKPGDR